MMFLRFLDRWLNTITIYRLVLYGLSLLAFVTVTLGGVGQLHFSMLAQVGSLAILLPGCYLINKLLAWLWPAASNSESSLITALILFFIMTPATNSTHAVGLAVVALLAMASKYLLAWRRKHLFNPAAIAAVLAGVTGVAHASWWVAAPPILPAVLLLALLVLRKTRRMQLFLVFMATSLVVIMGMAAYHDRDLGQALWQIFTSWPLIFMGSIMLSEPATMPPRYREQMVYGALVGVLFAAQLRVGSLAVTPEVALVVGNIFAYVVSPKYRLILRLKRKVRLSDHVYDLSFAADRPFQFLPGQYADWTLPHRHLDDRGNRRTFTLASSPTEREIHIGIKTYHPSSSFKRALLAMEPGQAITMGQIAGSFTLPQNVSRKLAFVAGGIGITPFRSMLAYLQDSGQQRDIILFYFVSAPEEVSYQEVLAAAEARGVRVVRVLTASVAPPGWKGRVGTLTPELLAAEAPDYATRTFYLSGPPAMVDDHWQTLRRLGVRHIVTDHFSGY